MRTEPVELDSFTAISIDAADGLTKQFRLKTHFPATPPGAVEEARVDFMLLDDHKKGDAEYRLRLHSPTQFFDFKFRLILDYVEPPAENKTAPGKKK